jgi:hypothetical protein
LCGLVLLVDNSTLSRIVYHALAKEFSIEAVIREGRVARSTFLKRRLKRLGWRTLLGQIVFAKCIVPLLRRETAERRADILREYGMNEAPIPAQCVVDVASVNDTRTVTLLKELAPRVVVVNGTRILEEKLLNVAIVAQALIQPTTADNFSTYPLLQVANAIPLLKQGVRDALNGTLETLPMPTGQSQLWFHPTAYQYLKNRIASGIR